MSNRELEEEIQFHLDARAADLVKRGLLPEEAERQARIEFGSVARYVEQGREERGLRIWDLLRMDLREITRGLKRSPAFALLATLTLALGIGATVLVYSLVDDILLKPLPYGQAERLYNVRTIVPHLVNQYPDLPVNARHFLELRKTCGSCEALALMGSSSQILTGVGKLRKLEAALVSADVLATLGVRLQAGREFTSADEGPAAKPIAIISNDLWLGTFRGDWDVIGRTVLLNRVPTEIVGVLAAGFSLPRGAQLGNLAKVPERVDLLMPIQTDLSTLPGRGHFDWALLVKLRDGASAEEAAKELTQALTGFAADGMQGIHVKLELLKNKLTNEMRMPLLLLAMAAILLLLIACVNLGNLFSSRTQARERDAAIRLAIGASRADLMRQRLIEILCFSLVGGVVGLGLAWSGLQWYSTLPMEGISRQSNASLGWVAIGVGIAVALVAGLASGLGSLWCLWRSTEHRVFGRAQRILTERRSEHYSWQALVTLEAGLSLQLAILAGLLLLSYSRVMSVDRGFATEHAFTFDAATDGSHEEILTALREMNGVAAVGLTSLLPLRGESCVRQIKRAGATATAEELTTANWRYISPGFFEAAGTQIRAGRGFSEADRQSRVVVISERTARQVFRGKNAIGELIISPNEDGPQQFKVIGVVPDSRTNGLETEAKATAYLPYWEWMKGDASFVVRSRLSEPEAMAGLQNLARSLDGNVAMGPVTALRQIVDQSLAWRRTQTLLTGAFAMLGGLMACVGIFGMVAQLLVRRSNEIAVRMALGATRKDILRLVFWESMRPVLLGVVGGQVCLVLHSSLIAPQLYGVSSRDPWVLIGMSVLVAGMAMLAVYGQTWRALQAQPVKSLRLD